MAPERLLAVARNDVLRCWDVVTGRHLGDLAGAASCALTGGRRLAVGHTDGSITVDPL
ncbi:hypothetical protein [Actinoplanes sp. NPDC049316]|uniref:hypothetical protein n=1 Tax=Actinoplanes sp. NPDC049316 TaxID=3154727 RepID=UPI003437415A